MLHDNLKINEKGHLTFAELDTIELAKEYGTPLMLIDENRIRERMRLYKKAMKNFSDSSMPLFASKALCFKEIYRIAKEEEIGIDVVSSGELYTAVSVEFPMEKVFFHGNNKTDEDIKFAIENNIGYFVADNFEELSKINELASRKGVVQKVIIRLTPGIDPHTHASISTGKVDSKFGVAIETGQADEIVKFALTLENVKLVGFHCHIGSQIFEVEPFLMTVNTMVEYVFKVKKEFNTEIEILDIGGGFACRYVESDGFIDYEKNLKEIATLIKNKVLESGIKMPTIFIEPGRSMVADSGLTLYTVGSIKEIKNVKNYVSIDGGMTDNPRYALYQSSYTVVNATRADKKADYVCSVAGRCCESGDLIQENVKLARPVRDDILAVLCTGAYNYSMASNYNRIPRPPIVMVKDGKSRIVVKRESFDDIIKNEV
ncbi:MAG: diaminopimelate decarboxylase [Clostridiales bacterium]|nr:diaminopimelate decarboxylase [Clostridiales bacterium]